MATQAGKALTRREIRQILKRHRGSMQVVADRAVVVRQAVSIWLRGRLKSSNIAGHARAHALELLEQEQREQAA